MPVTVQSMYRAKSIRGIGEPDRPLRIHSVGRVIFTNDTRTTNTPAEPDRPLRIHSVGRVIFTNNTRTTNTPAEPDRPLRIHSVGRVIFTNDTRTTNTPAEPDRPLRIHSVGRVIFTNNTRTMNTPAEPDRPLRIHSAGAWRTVHVVSENHGFHRAKLGGEPAKQILCRTLFSGGRWTRGRRWDGLMKTTNEGSGGHAPTNGEATGAADKVSRERVSK